MQIYGVSILSRRQLKQKKNFFEKILVDRNIVSNFAVYYYTNTLRL